MVLAGTFTKEIGRGREDNKLVALRRELDSSLWVSRGNRAFAMAVGRKVVSVGYLPRDLTETDGLEIARASIDCMRTRYCRPVYG